MAPAERSDETSSPDKEADGERARRPFSNTRADSPQAKGGGARARGRASERPADGGGSTARWLVLSLVIAGVIMAGRLYFQNRAASTPAPAAAPPKTTAAPVPSAATAANTTPPQPPAASATAANTEPSAAPDATASGAAPPASAEPPASASPEGTRVVIVKLSPPGARLFYKGKPVGSSPVRVELAPGEKRRAFEVGMPGWVTRRLVVDGSKPEMFIGLKPE
jgi:hypothetical protein